MKSRSEARRLETAVCNESEVKTTMLQVRGFFEELDLGVEKQLGKAAGVARAEAKPASERITVDYDEIATNPPELKRLVNACRYHRRARPLPAHPCDSDQHVSSTDSGAGAKPRQPAVQAAAAAPTRHKAHDVGYWIALAAGEQREAGLGRQTAAASLGQALGAGATGLMFGLATGGSALMAAAGLSLIAAGVSLLFARGVSRTDNRRIRAAGVT